MSPEGPYLGTSAVDEGGPVAWTNPSYAYQAPGSSNYASASYFIDVFDGSPTNELLVSNFGFSIPSTAVIDGIQVQYNVYGNNLAGPFINLTKGTGMAGGAGGSVATYTVGDSTSLWGGSWSPSDINSSGFGVYFSFSATHDPSDANVNLNGVEITVWWHTGPAYVPHRYIYQVFNSAGQFIGSLPKVTTPYQTSQDVNTAGTTLAITCAVSPDTPYLPGNDLTDESGNLLTDENLNQLTDEGQVPMVSLGTGPQALIQNGNQIVVYDVGYWHPNGKVVFQGELERWEASYGGNGDGSGGATTSDSGAESISMLVYSNGQDLDNFMLRGYPYTFTSDVAQGASNVFGTIDADSKGAAFQAFGQTWQAGTTNLGALNLAFLGYANVTINIYNNPGQQTLLGSITQYVSCPSEAVVQFALPTELITVSGTEYFFTVTVDPGDSIQIAYQNTAVYSYGTAYYQSYGGGGGGGYYPITGDLYFETFSGTGSTTATFTTVEPVAGILEPIMNDYIARGGLITYDSSTITPTTLSLSCEFNTNSIYEGIQTVLQLSPSAWYFYVDLGTDTLYFKEANTVADITFTKDHDLTQVTIIATIENLINNAYFTGGVPSGDTDSIYVNYSNPTSIAQYGPRLDRPSDSNVVDQATAYTVAEADVLGNDTEQNQTTITVMYPEYDLTLLKPGLMVGLQGFGTFVDSLLLQIVRVDTYPEYATLTLGFLPPRLVPDLDQVTRGLIGLETISNPSSPSFSV